jgi:hypothetical protein
LKTEVSVHGPQVVPSPEGPCSVQYDRPMGGGESMATIVAVRDQEYGLNCGEGTPVLL